MIYSSSNNMRAALQAAQKYLSQDPNAPAELICQIFNGLAPIDWDEEPQENYKAWLLAGGEGKVKSDMKPEQLFCLGFEFALEKLEYEFTSPQAISVDL